MPGSAREVKAMFLRRGDTQLKGYKKVREQFAGKDWEIVGFDQKQIVLRIERTNYAFKFSGQIATKFDLGPLRNPKR